jgi:hypothetical protein
VRSEELEKAIGERRDASGSSQLSEMIRREKDQILSARNIDREEL